MNTPFFSRSTISFCLNAVNDDTIDSAVVLKIKLAADAKNFLKRPRPRLIDAVGTIESIVMRSACSEIDFIDDSADDSIDETDNSSLA
jgi:hypothetical protein